MISFSKDTDNKTMHIVREFKAPREKVWKAWTESSLLDQWWGPEPWHAKTKSFDFKKGGRWLYAMVGPEGEMHWSVCKFQSVNPPESFSSTSQFSDADGNPAENSPLMYWLVEMREDAGVTTVNVSVSFDDVSGLEQIVNMGFQGGFTIGLNQLEKLLAEA